MSVCASINVRVKKGEASYGDIDMRDWSLYVCVQLGRSSFIYKYTVYTVVIERPVWLQGVNRLRGQLQ